jgi:hypothetical protein
MSRSARVPPLAAKPAPGLLRIAETIAAGCALGLLLTRPRWGLRVLSLLSARHRLSGGVAHADDSAAAPFSRRRPPASPPAPPRSP